MINIKSIFFTTGISFIFGIYSIYNIFDYIRVLNNYRVKQITILQHQINDSDRKFSEISKKHIELQKNYSQLLMSYESIQEEVKLLNIKLEQFDNSKSKNINSYSNLNNNDYEYSIIKNELIFKDNLICDELCQLNNEIPRLQLKTMSNQMNNIDKEFEESLSLIYETSDPNNLSSLSNSEKEFPRSRSSSITEINWGILTKKFLFG